MLRGLRLPRVEGLSDQLYQVWRRGMVVEGLKKTSQLVIEIFSICLPACRYFLDPPVNAGLLDD